MGEQNVDVEGRGQFDWGAARHRIAKALDALNVSAETAPELLHELWKRRAEELATPQDKEESGETLSLVIVRLGREYYALNVQYVSDIRPAIQITRAPRVPAWIAGVTNARGRILSVLDLARFLGLEGDRPVPVMGQGMLVVVETADLALGLLVDGVLMVDALPVRLIREIPETLRGVPEPWALGVVDLGDTQLALNRDGVLVVLDVGALLADPRLIIDEKV